MKTVKQTLTLTSAAGYGRRIPSEALGQLLSLIGPTIRYAIRMQFESRSRARGKRPPWLTAASDVRFIGHRGDEETVLQFEVPLLGAAAAELYRQGELIPLRPPSNDTGFDLIGDVIRDISANDTNSARFDSALLRQVGHFGPVVGGAFQALRFESSREDRGSSTVLTKDVIAGAKSLLGATPPPRTLTVVGKLDGIQLSTQSFVLELDNGQRLRGQFASDSLLEHKGLLGNDVLVRARALYRPSGQVLRLDAKEIVLATAQDAFFRRLPELPEKRLSGSAVPMKVGGIASVFGKWPGDESDEEILATLRAMG